MATAQTKSTLDESNVTVLRIKEKLINLANEMKHKEHGTQQPRHINRIGEGASAAQRNDLLMQSINQRFLNIDEQNRLF